MASSKQPLENGNFAPAGGSRRMHSFEPGDGTQHAEDFPFPRLWRMLGALGFVAGVTLVFSRGIRVDTTTAALTYLLVVLGIATAWGLAEAIVASISALIGLNFLLPLAGRRTIGEPENWVAVIAFLATSVIASELSSKAKQRAEQAILRQHELERLYALSRSLLLVDGASEPAKQIAHQVARAFELRGVAFYDRASNRVYRAGPEDVPADESKLRDAAMLGSVSREAGALTIPIRLGGEPIGSLAIEGAGVSETALHSIGNLAAIALERARAQETASNAEAVRQSEELKSALLDALAHEFKTPLTPIKAAVTSMLADGTLTAAHEELLRLVDEQTDRLSSIVSEAIRRARIEAGKVQLETSPHAPASLIQPALEKLRDAMEGRSVEVNVPEDLPAVNADAELAGIVLWQLVNNALRYTPPGSPFAIRARGVHGFVAISVADRGPGIELEEQSRLFDKFYRCRRHRDLIPGTGMGLAIAREIVRAHGGKIWVESRPGAGAEFIFTLPKAGSDAPL